MQQHFGIDFGTTNSATVGYYLGNMTLFDGGQGLPFPSVIAIDKMTGEVVARGREVKAHHEEMSKDHVVIGSVKTFLGTETVWNIGPRTWTPTEVAAEIFKGLAGLVHDREQARLENATVSIPVGFSPRKRRELRRAAEMAGLSISGFVSEPTAAVFKNFDYLAARQKVAVFDWGGGTLDIVVVDISGGIVSELASSGKSMGGDALDEKIARWVHQKIITASGQVGISFDEMDSLHRDELLIKAESVKCNGEGRILLYGYGPFGDKMVTVKRGELEELLSPEIDIAIAELSATIRKARMSPSEIGCILMVGGSSKLVGLYDRVLRAFDSTDVLPPPKDADWNMAQGAAMLEARKGEEVLSCNIGLELPDGTFFPILQEGPLSEVGERSMRFGLVEDTRSATFVFYESTSCDLDAIEKNMARKIGYLSAPAFGFLNEPIILNSNIDENLLFTATAKSSRMGDVRSKIWEYEELKFKYRLPGR